MFSLFVSRSENTRKSSLEILRPTRSSQMAIEFGLLVVCMDAPCQEKPVDADHRVKGTSLDMFGQKNIKLPEIPATWKKHLKFRWKALY